MERGRGNRDNLKVLQFRRQRRMGRVHGGPVELCRELQYGGITRDKESTRKVERGSRCHLWAVAKSVVRLRLKYLCRLMTPFQSRGVFFCVPESLTARLTRWPASLSLAVPLENATAADRCSADSSGSGLPTWENQVRQNEGTQSILLLDGFYDGFGELVYRCLAFWSPWYHFGQTLGEGVNAITLKAHTGTNQLGKHARVEWPLLLPARI